MPRVYTTLLKVTRIRLRIIAIDCASFTSVCVAVAEAILWRQHGSERIDPWRARRRWIRGSRGATADQHAFSVAVGGFQCTRGGVVPWFPNFRPHASPSRRVAIALSSAGVPQAVKALEAKELPSVELVLELGCKLGWLGDLEHLGAVSRAVSRARGQVFLGRCTFLAGRGPQPAP